jgi:hypothetical protein
VAEVKLLRNGGSEGAILETKRQKSEIKKRIHAAAQRANNSTRGEAKEGT